MLCQNDAQSCSLWHGRSAFHNPAKAVCGERVSTHLHLQTQMQNQTNKMTAGLKPRPNQPKNSMKRHILMLMGVLGLGVTAAQAQTVMLNSWENSTEGWSILETSAWTSDGFSTSNGVTQGTYSWALTTPNNPNYGNTLQGPSSTSLTALLAHAATLSMDVQVATNAPAFGYGLQID